MSRRRRPGPTPRRRPPAERGSGWVDALFGLAVVGAVLGGSYGGTLLTAAAARASGAAARTDAVAAPVFVGGVALGGVGSLLLLLLVVSAVRRRTAPAPDASAPRGGDLRTAGRAVADVTAPTGDPQVRDRNAVVLLATLCAAVAPALALVLVTALLVALADVVPDALLGLLAILLSLVAVVVAGPVAYQLVSGRAADEYPGGRPVPGLGRLRRGGRPFPRPPD